MDFNNVKNDQYYVFGCRFAKKDGTIDYKQLSDELDELKYYLAATQFECDDVGFFLRLPPYSPAKWILDADEGYDVTEEEFKSLTESKFFKKFAKVIPEKLQAGFGALQMVSEDDLSKNGIKKSDIENASKQSMRLVTIAKAAVKKPELKAMPK